MILSRITSTLTVASEIGRLALTPFFALIFKLNSTGLIRIDELKCQSAVLRALLKTKDERLLGHKCSCAGACNQEVILFTKV